MKDKLILLVKNAIDDNATHSVGEDDLLTLDCNDVDHIAEQMADEVVKLLEAKDDEIASKSKYAEYLVAYIKDREKRIIQARKIGAKDFAEKLRKKYGMSCSEFYPELIEVTSEQLNDLLKEFENGKD